VAIDGPIAKRRFGYQLAVWDKQINWRMPARFRCDLSGLPDIAIIPRLNLKNLEKHRYLSGFSLIRGKR
jgi:hypothetical protein